MRAQYFNAEKQMGTQLGQLFFFFLFLLSILRLRGTFESSERGQSRNV
jgi:hypothetical protein